MKNKLSSFLIIVIAVFILIELTDLAFLLMNYPNTVIFYIGFLLILTELFIIGWYFLLLFKEKKLTEKNDEESK